MSTGLGSEATPYEMCCMSNSVSEPASGKPSLRQRQKRAALVLGSAPSVNRINNRNCETLLPMGQARCHVFCTHCLWMSQASLNGKRQKFSRNSLSKIEVILAHGTEIDLLLEPLLDPSVVIYLRFRFPVLASDSGTVSPFGGCISFLDCRNQSPQTWVT